MAGKKVIITGVPGVGKTTVINTAMEKIAAEGTPYQNINFGSFMFEVAAAEGLHLHGAGHGYKYVCSRIHFRRHQPCNKHYQDLPNPLLCRRQAIPVARSPAPLISTLILSHFPPSKYPHGASEAHGRPVYVLRRQSSADLPRRVQLSFRVALV